MVTSGSAWWFSTTRDIGGPCRRSAGCALGVTPATRLGSSLGARGGGTLLVTRVDSRRVLVLGLVGLVPAALVTLLVVHQPSIGDRRLYPMVRGPLALVGLVLALATVITWATAPDRLGRASLSGLAWAGVTTILCIGPFLESTPRALASTRWSSPTATSSGRRAADWAAPIVVDGDLVVTGRRR